MAEGIYLSELWSWAWLSAQQAEDHAVCILPQASVNYRWHDISQEQDSAGEVVFGSLSI